MRRSPLRDWGSGRLRRRAQKRRRRSERRTESFEEWLQRMKREIVQAYGLPPAFLREVTSSRVALLAQGEPWR